MPQSQYNNPARRDGNGGIFFPRAGVQLNMSQYNNPARRDGNHDTNAMRNIAFISHNTTIPLVGMETYLLRTRFYRMERWSQYNNPARRDGNLQLLLGLGASQQRPSQYNNPARRDGNVDLHHANPRRA